MYDHDAQMRMLRDRLYEAVKHWVVFKDDISFGIFLGLRTALFLSGDFDAILMELR